MSKMLDTLASYVPWLIARRFTEDATPQTEPFQEQFPAAVLFADISGFTKLAEKLTQRGPTGAEQITRILNSYFGQLIDLIAVNGGDVVKFAGDGLYAIWPCMVHDEDLETITRRAIQSALEIQEKLNDYEVAPGERLSMRIGIGAGDVLAATVGGVLKRWEFLLTGDPVRQMNAASEIGYPGAVVLSTKAWQLVEPFADGVVIDDDNVRLKGIHTRLKTRPLPPVSLAEGAEEALRGFVAGAILQRLKAGQVDWLAENRRVTVLFVNLRDLNQHTEAVIERLHEVMQAMQVSLYHFEGSVRQFIMDDKGTVFIAAFGVPPLTHEDDPLRGVHAALTIQSKLKDMGLESSIGIATGLTFCGPVGNYLRREYAMVSDIVYLSARLMVAADNGILCDETTYQATRSRITYEALIPIQVKNKTQAVSVYAPQSTSQDESARLPVIGRDIEQAVLIGQLDRLRDEKNSVAIVQGEAGVGKSRLISNLIKQATARKVEVFEGEGDYVDRTTPYYGWRDVFSQMFEMDNFTQTRSRSLSIMAKLATDPELTRLAPLLNALLPLEIPETEVTEMMTGEARAENTRLLLLRLLELNMRKSSGLIVLDDAQWLDSASWALALAASRNIKPLMLVIVMRPAVDLPQEYEQLLESDITQVISLQPFSEQNALTLLRQTLDVTYIPDNVAKVILERTQGNAFFTEQLAYTLRDSGYIVIVDGECKLAPNVASIDHIHLPDTIQGVITSRIDRLPPPEQLTLKVASTIGPEFSYRALQDIYPIKSDRDKLKDHLHTLEQLDLIEVAIPSPDLAYEFRQNITQEIAYNLMSFSQRRELHEAIARWYERNFVYDLSPFYSFLAHHWQKAEVYSKAIDYLQKAAQQALRGGAYREVVDFLHEAMTLEESTVQSGNTPRQARWSSQISEAYWGLGDLDQSRIHAEKTLALLELPMPETASQLRMGLYNQMLHQIVHRLFPRYFIGRKTQQRGTILPAVRAYLRLQEIFYFSNQRLPGFYTGYRGLNLAESAGSTSRELASAYANACVGLVVLRQNRLATRFSRRAKSLAAQFDDPPTDAFVASRLGIYHTSMGQWEDGRDSFEQAIRLYEKIGNRRNFGDSLTALGFAEYLSGSFSRAKSLYQELQKTALSSNNREHLAWSMSGLGTVAMEMGNLNEAIELLQSAHNILITTADRLATINNLGMLALAYVRQSNFTAAKQTAEATNETIGEAAPMGYVAYGGYTSIPDVYLSIWAATSDNSLATVADEALQQLSDYAWSFTIGRPRLWLLRGNFHWLSGNQGKAQKAWRKSLELGRQLNMRYDMALAHHALARHLNDTHPDQQSHLDYANGIFHDIGANLFVENDSSR
jgi:class 3 adenylate cyclase/tetratricopeptide (TPR) repeat protein